METLYDYNNCYIRSSCSAIRTIDYLLDLACKYFRISAVENIIMSILREYNLIT
jgi:hypothetical protein